MIRKLYKPYCRPPRWQAAPPEAYQLRFLSLLLLVSLFSSWKSFAPSLSYILSLFKPFRIPLLCSLSVWEEGSRLNGSQRGPWTSRGETLDLAQALNHLQISPSALSGSLLLPSSPPSFFLSLFVDSPAVDPDALLWGEQLKHAILLWKSKVRPEFILVWKSNFAYILARKE